MLFWIIGVLTCLIFIMRVLHWLWQNVSPRNCLSNTYGPNTWALITGASDGIGKGFAHILAKNGFKVCLIARNSEKLEIVRKNILDGYPKAEIKCIVADFKNSLEPGFFNKIYEQIKDLDISILVNNVGVADMSVFHQTQQDIIEELLLVNLFPQLIITKKLILKLKNRTQSSSYKSAIINLSSMAGTKPIPFDIIYSCSKSLNDFFSRAISVEYRHKIEIISLRPFYVSTQMVFNKRPGIDTLTPEECAEGCLKDLGTKDYSWGHYKHETQGIIFSLLPDWIVLNSLKVMGPMLVKDRDAKLREVKKA